MEEKCLTVTEERKGLHGRDITFTGLLEIILTDCFHLDDTSVAFSGLDQPSVHSTWCLSSVSSAKITFHRCTAE